MNLVTERRRSTFLFAAGQNASRGLRQLISTLRLAPQARHTLLEEPAFRRQLERERELADRHDRRFAVIVLAPRSAAELEDCIEVLDERLRTTDVLGMLARGQVAALLAETSGAEATLIARDIEFRLQLRGLQLVARVLSYPFDASDGRAERPQNVGDASELLLEAPSAFKRIVDITGATLGLVALSPLLAAIAVAVKLDSRGPVFYRQQRAGRGGRPFAFYKFRSMVVDADTRLAELGKLNEASGPIFKMRRDPRVTRVGAILRKYSLDELPQLWNVLRGDMSIVGPRPPKVEEVASYERWQRRRLDLPGGLTCIWQVSGRSNVGFVEWMRMDLRYAKARSSLLDLLLILRTIPCVITGRGAY
ncbi:MAG: sugar transferase [Planctomycetota bacterium]|nr:sugar transferase [Planctomycetota bacterium]